MRCPHEPGCDPARRARPLEVIGTDLGYWFPLFALMLTSLGWVRPDAGLNWCSAPGNQPTTLDSHSPTMGGTTDGALQSLTCELWQYEGFWAFSELGDHLGRIGYRADRTVHRGRIAEEFAEELACTPKPGSQDPWHMAGHLGMYASMEANPANARLVATDPRRGRAMLVTDHMNGWYAALARLGNDLKKPALPGRMSWHVDVVVEHVIDPHLTGKRTKSLPPHKIPVDLH